MGQDPRTFLKDAIVFVIRFYITIFVVLLPIPLLLYLIKLTVPVTTVPTNNTQLPPQLWFLLVPFIIYVFCAVATAIAVLSGWRKLAGKFPSPQNFTDGQLFTWQSGTVGVANYNNVLIVRVSSHGLYLDCIFPFRLMHPPILIPWAQVKAVRQTRFLGSSTIFLTIGSPKLATISLKNAKIIEAARQWLPQG